MKVSWSIESKALVKLEVLFRGLNELLYSITPVRLNRSVVTLWDRSFPCFVFNNPGVFWCLFFLV